jgi:ATP phosphoribosyltransferase regulatory subunit
MTAAPDKAAILAIARDLHARFVAAGAVPVETDILQPAETLLDLYGEDIRARAYVTADPVRGEMMLRPDFTVPVVQMHMANGADPARYTYLGEVFRRQDIPGPRASEYLQVGYEVFDRADPAAADAEVFALFADILRPLALRPVTGDIGLLLAAVSSLTTSPARRAALMRHIWRPTRFRALLDRFGGRVPRDPTRLRAGDIAAQIEAAGAEIGKRSAAEVAARLALLLADADCAPIPAAQVDALDALLALSCPASEALGPLRALTQVLPGLGAATTGFAARLAALSARGIAPETLAFEANFGRTTMEYYDGFVFGFLADRADLPPVATGGRYDALTAVLGHDGAAIPAVGGVIRPAMVAILGGLA